MLLVKSLVPPIVSFLFLLFSPYSFHSVSEAINSLSIVRLSNNCGFRIVLSTHVLSWSARTEGAAPLGATRPGVPARRGSGAEGKILYYSQLNWLYYLFIFLHDWNIMRGCVIFIMKTRLIKSFKFVYSRFNLFSPFSIKKSLQYTDTDTERMRPSAFWSCDNRKKV